ncbi:GNAT family N-acetyltransferase [Verminephrobacter aporrectodeae]|uniref:GNAT family N-acetyltransferase n=1 Tax=Verminephrobacter aporrectodeae TaxID=1110389 RepID=UPI00224466B0|nr:GNAT family N-acetyltransferase [Verminephrobacter aporrectodeae]MCW8174525.1 GNAT family N-acetyltransferase [Verminephrobacter aporrectodeae subsp. tuberculatae]MCW8202183.1 GNAT family N-acetyltransferase [Verminephrobacter aporrectodeae subsp. tuberculatae]
MNTFYEEITEPEPEQVEPLRSALKAFNASQLGDYGADTLLITARSESGDLHGAVYGRLQFGWLYIHLLWVDPVMHRRGIASALLEKMESYAASRGIRRGRLATSDFQPGYDLYRKRGWTVYAKVPILPDRDTGVDLHVEYLMWKHWDVQDESHGKGVR